MKTAITAIKLQRYNRFSMQNIKTDFQRNKHKYLMILPVVLFYIIFCYKPMYGAIIAFKDFSPGLGIMNSPWVGFKYFSDFFTDTNFWRVIKNTFLISFYDILFGFPAPIILALLLNEMRHKTLKGTIQTTLYLPHFISIVVVCGMIKSFVVTDGVVNDIIAFFGEQRISMLQVKSLFRTIYVSTNIWQELGWGSIIYIAALSGIDQEQYEAARIDGANRFQQVLHITIPGIAETIIIMLILRLGQILNVGFEKIILLYNPSVLETSDVISSFVYRKGLQEFNWSFSTAVGLFNSVINFGFLIVANYISKKTTDSGLW